MLLPRSKVIDDKVREWSPITGRDGGLLNGRGEGASEVLHLRIWGGGGDCKMFLSLKRVGVGRILFTLS